MHAAALSLLVLSVHVLRCNTATLGSCPTHSPPSVTFPEDVRVTYASSLIFDGTGPDCYDPAADDWTRSPSSYAACQELPSEPDDAAQELAQTLCAYEDTEDAVAQVGKAIMSGGSDAETAVAAAVYAARDLCPSSLGDSLTDMVTTAPDSVVGDTAEESVSNYLSFFANLLDASEQAGMGVCIVVYSIDENDNQELLATLHTGTDSGVSPSPDESPSPPGASPSPNDGECPVHEAVSPTVTEDLSIRSSSVFSWDGSAPECYDTELDDSSPAPASYAPCKAPDSNPDDAVKELAQTLCDARQDDLETQVAEGIQQGGDTAIQTVAALIYGYLEVGCFQDGIATLFSPPEGFISGDSLAEIMDNNFAYYANLANAAEQAGLGLCVVFYTHDGNDQDRQPLAVVHTGPDSSTPSSPIPGRSSAPSSPFPGRSSTPGSSPRPVRSPSPAGNPTLPDGVDTIYTSASYSFTGDAPDCYSPETDDTISSPSTYEPTGRFVEPSNDVKDTAQTYCDDPEKGGEDFAAAVLEGGSQAEAAVQAVMYIDKDLACFDDSSRREFFNAATDAVNPPGEASQEVLDQVILYFTNMAEAGNANGLGLCAVVYVEVDNTRQTLATIHTGEESSPGSSPNPSPSPRTVAIRPTK